MDENAISNKVVGAAIEVHKTLGPGLLEGVYQKCLAYELKLQGFDVGAEIPLPVRYKDLVFKDAYRIDLLVDKKLVVELKAVESMLPVYHAQLLSYLKMSGLKLGLLINFNTPYLRDGVKRIVNKL